MSLDKNIIQALSQIQTKYPAAYSDFLAVINASPLYQQQLTDFINRGGTINVADFQNAAGDNGQFQASKDSPLNTNFGVITISPNMLPSGRLSI